MKRKTIVMLILLGVVLAGCQPLMTPAGPQTSVTETPKDEAAMLERIRQLEIIHKEQLFIRDILKLKVEIANIKTANAPPQPLAQTPPSNPAPTTDEAVSK